MELMSMLGDEVVSSGAGFDLVIAPKNFPSQGAAHLYNAFPSPILRDILIALLPDSREEALALYPHTVWWL
jgi:hypothetical protein